MFRIIGGDSRQYGPVTADDLREWIRLGRAAASTLAQRDGETDWKPLSSFPEFADAFAGAAGEAGPAAASPTDPLATDVVPGLGPEPQTPADADQLTEEALHRAIGVDIGGALGRGWDLLAGDFWPIVGLSTLVTVVLLFANSVFIGIFLAGPILGGLQWYFLKRIRGQSAEMSDAFAGFSSVFLPLMLGYLVMSLLGALGLILCLLPGIYLLVAWQFALLLTIDKKLDFWPAMEVSRKVITRDWWSFFALALVCWLLNVVGGLLCGVGFLVTWPWTLIAMTLVYEERFGFRNDGRQLAAPPT